MFKAVVFDLDGVITDTAAFHFIAWRKLGKSLGIEVIETFNEELKGIDRLASLNKILALGSMENRFSKEEKEALAQEKNDFYVTLINEISPADILPGIEQLLQDLDTQHIKVGLASASKNAPKILRLLGLADSFSTIVDPATLQQGKPDPEIFIKACEQLQVQQEEAIGVEDAYSGIQAINAAKLYSVGIGDKHMLKDADYVFGDTAHLTFSKLKEIWENRTL